MDFGRLLSRAWDIIWEHKFLIVLGIIVAITGGGGGGGGGGSSNPAGFGDTGEYGDSGDWGFKGAEELDLPDFDELAAAGIATGVIIAIVCVALIIGIVLFFISRVATGGLIAGVNQIETVGTSSFSEAWSVGWGHGVRMFLIGLVGSLPILVTMLLIVILFATMVGFNTQVEDMEALAAGNVGLLVTIGAMFCLGLLVQIVVGAIQTFADRACILQEKRVFESYIDGWGVLKDNLGPAVLLFLIQIGIQIVLWLVLVVPSIILTVCCCCIAIPLMWVIGGTAQAYFSTVWTLAWREWMGKSGSEPVVIEQAPAV